MFSFWDWSDEWGLQVKQAEGFFAGLEVHLNQMGESREENRIALVGQVHFHGEELAPLLSKTVRELVQSWRLGSGYELSGRFLFDKDNLGALSFEGALLGRNFEIKDHLLRTLHAQVSLTPDELRLEDAMVVDAGGSFRVPLAQLHKEGDRWRIHLPEFVAEEVRLDRFQPINDVIEDEKSLLIRSVEIREGRGYLDDPSSWMAEGFLEFVNPSRRNLRNTLLAIPSEILMRLGLTSEAMTPVIGTVHFDIHDRRLFLSEFEDMYSEGRISKFFLATGPVPIKY